MGHMNNEQPKPDQTPENVFAGADSNKIAEAPVEAPQVVEKTAEAPSLREVGRARIEKIKGFFSGAKENLKAKLGRARDGIAAAGKRAGELGIAGLETVLATPEAVSRGVEYTVGAIETQYNSARDLVKQKRDNLITAKNSLIERGQNAVKSGVEAVVDAKNATVQFAHESMARAAEKMATPFLRFQEKRIAAALRVMADRIEKGTMSPEEARPLEALLAQLQTLTA